MPALLAAAQFALPGFAPTPNFAVLQLMHYACTNSD